MTGQKGGLPPLLQVSTIDDWRYLRNLRITTSAGKPNFLTCYCAAFDNEQALLRHFRTVSNEAVTNEDLARTLSGGTGWRSRSRSS